MLADPVIDPRNARSLDQMEFVAKWNGYKYVVWDAEWKCYVPTNKPHGRDVKWTANKE